MSHRSHRYRALLRCCLLLVCFAWPALPVWAAGLDYRVELEVPAPYRELLTQHLEIERWRGNARVNLEQLRRLFRDAPADIHRLLATEGYYSSKTQPSLKDVDGTWVARFAVVPGEPARVSEVTVQVEGAVNDGTAAGQARVQRIRQQWSLAVGAVFRQADWEKAKRDALRQLLADRYAAARLSHSRARVDPATHRVALAVTLDSGPAFTFGNLEVNGLRRYPRRIVERLNPITPGEPYSQKALLEFQRNLVDSPYFSNAVVTVDTDPAHPERVPVRVAVTEMHARRLGLGLGFSTNTGARGQVTYRDLNLLDHAWRLSSALKLETKSQSLSTELQFPITALGDRDSLFGALERTDIEGETTRKLALGARRKRVKGNLETTVGLEYQVERQYIAGAPTNLNRALVPSYGWTKRHLDNLLYPRRGYVFTAQVAGAARSVLSDQSFVRLYGRATWFRPVGVRDGVILRAEGGWVLAPSRDGIPSDYLFRAGGDQSVRGFAYQSLGVHEGDAVVGGRYLAVGSAEYVHWFTPKWGGALFYDLGNAADSVSGLRPVHGYGVGARWRSPLGPLNLDLAYGQERREWRLHFSLGFSL